MRIAVFRTFPVAAGLLLAVFLSVAGYYVLHRRGPDAPESLLKRADEMSWLNDWIAAAPLYRPSGTSIHSKRSALAGAVGPCSTVLLQVRENEVFHTLYGRGLIAALSYNPAQGFPRVVPELRYKDATAAVEWLCRVFGFTEILRWTRPDGSVGHADLELERGIVMVAAGPDGFSVAADPLNFCVQIVFFVDDVDAHFLRSKAYHVRIISEPRDKPWGLRQYLALDLEGHGWEFSQHIRDVAPASWGAISSQPVR